MSTPNLFKRNSPDVLILSFIVGVFFFLNSAQAESLKYHPSPADNPLKGLVPYSSAEEKDRFPHSMEFRYLPVNEVMKGWGRFDWTLLEKSLEESRARGKQSIVRFYLEYPGRPSAVPSFLLNEGLTVTSWKEGGKAVLTPDYANPLLKRALAEFITNMGAKYDGDPRIGFLTAGLLGLWGEWHNYPRVDLAPGKKIQEVVMDSFETAFPKTHVLLRYPAGEGDQEYARNHHRKLGYHDDSFAWATLETEKEHDQWFFMTKLRTAKALDHWKQFPIGGEIRPEVWPTVFTEKRTGQEQDFAECVSQSHVSWLMDSSMFSNRFPVDQKRIQRGISEVQRMGYELYLSKAEFTEKQLIVTIENRGVAPFYYDWPVLLNGVIQPEWKLSKILPGQIVTWKGEVDQTDQVRLKIPNPMPLGNPLKFANVIEPDGSILIRRE